MASRHQGKHKPRHHTHANKPTHTFKNMLPPLSKPDNSAQAASTPSTSTAVSTLPEPTQTASQTPATAE